MTTGDLAALAEDPEAVVEPPDGSRRVADDRFVVVIGPNGRWAGVNRLRLADDKQAVADAVAEIRALVAGVQPVVWNVGSSATPGELPALLRDHGLTDPDPPMDPVCAAMVLDRPPPQVEGVEVRRVASLDEHLAGLEIMFAAAEWDPAAAEAERARAEETYERRTRRGGYQWLAYLGGRPVAYGAADATPAGLFLAGGSTRPEARGRGCYRALVRARWDESVRLGTPGLAVQAQYGTSAPVLRGIGFTEVATVHTLQDRG